MRYLDRIAIEHPLSMDRVISISREFLPEACRRRPWDYTGHGVNLLSNEVQMDSYLTAYGEMHMMKCRAAFQNFPFENLPFNVEIVDWGCGQGIATLTFLDVLRERGLIDRIKKVTLVEPSVCTLARAEANVRNALYGKNVIVCPINKYLPAPYPSPEAVSSSDLYFTAAATVNLFSNILDIVAVDLRNTARLLLSSGRTHYVICMSPMNENCGRVDEFCQLLNAEDYFSHITSRNFASTSDTHHQFGCLTRGFIVNGVKGASINENVQLGHYSPEGAYDDYDRRALVRNGLLSEGFVRVFEGFSSHLSSEDSIFIKPTFESDNPDIVIVRPRYGVLVVKVFENDINGLTMKSKDICQGDNPIMVSPIQTVLGYKKNLEELYSSKIVQARVKDKRAYYIVKTAVCFPKIEQGMARAFCLSDYNELSNSDKHCVAILGSDSFDNDIWDAVGFRYRCSQFDKAMSSEIIGLFSSKWHSYKEGDDKIRLNRAQLELAKSIDGNRRKIKGVAGSGKTQILVSRAVNCQMRTGGNVLILTYNITLANYIRYRLSQVPADFLWDNFTFGTYYRFFTSQAKNASLKLDIAKSYEDINFFNGVTDMLPKYDAILVDEAQDYKTEWMGILQKFFLKYGGEFVVFGDVKQNIYRRPLTEQKMVIVPNIPGEWKTLKKCYRMENGKLIELAMDFQRIFMPDLPVDEIERDAQIGFGGRQTIYADLGCTPSDVSIYNTLKRALGDLQADINKTAVLSATCEVLRPLDFTCRKDGIPTYIMCETMEDYETIKNNSGGKSFKFKQDQVSVRENKKHHFTMQKKGLKMSTVHSFKGWEAETVVLILQPYTNNSALVNPLCASNTELNDQVVYTAITRATKNLVIVNLGNMKYGPFFKEHIEDRYV